MAHRVQHRAAVVALAEVVAVHRARAPIRVTARAPIKVAVANAERSNR